jgi:sigma-B regulation protein RsbU (phosphoserine phosphatase)
VSVHRRLIGVFLVYVAIVVLGGAAVVAATRSRDEARDRARSTAVARQQVIRLRGAFIDQETGERGYLLTGEEAFLDPFDAGRAAAVRLFRSTDLRADDLVPLVDSTRRAWETWRDEGALPEIRIRRTQGEAAAAAAVATGETKALFDRLRIRVARLDRAAGSLNAGATQDVETMRRRLNVAYGVVLALMLAWTAIAIWLVRRWITLPLDDLGRTVRAARSGAIDATVSTRGPAEIARLGESVEDMRVQLVTARLDAIRSREAIEQSASVVLTLRSQLESEIGELPDGWTVAAELRAAEGLVAGDCYDVMRVDRNRFHVVLVDISGHGAVSGVLALRCKELLRAAMRNGLEPGPAIEFAAAQLDDLGDETFLSAFVASIELDSGNVAFANAGHPAGLLCAATGAVDLSATGPIVGPIAGAEWATEHATIAPGDTLALYTDGLIESRDLERTEFGVQRLNELVSGSSCDEAEEIAKRCLDEVEGFQHGRLMDDVTIVLVCRGPREKR